MTKSSPDRGNGTTLSDTVFHHNKKILHRTSTAPEQRNKSG